MSRVVIFRGKPATVALNDVEDRRQDGAPVDGVIAVGVGGVVGYGEVELFLMAGQHGVFATGLPSKTGPLGQHDLADFCIPELRRNLVELFGLSLGDTFDVGPLPELEIPRAADELDASVPIAISASVTLTRGQLLQALSDLHTFEQTFTDSGPGAAANWGPLLQQIRDDPALGERLDAMIREYRSAKTAKTGATKPRTRTPRPRNPRPE